MQELERLMPPDAIEERVKAGFMFDLAGRVRNLGLPANASNALVPLFEAVSNAIHAVETRWLERVTEVGEVTITVHRRDHKDEAHVVGFTVTDNGIGLNEDNWQSFRTSDSPLKLPRGGKGVGRLSWLKAFSNCHIVSRFADGGTIMQRSFSFSLMATNPIDNHTIIPAAHGSMEGTEVCLQPFEVNFEASCPKRPSTIAAKLVGHFLSYLVVEKAPRIVLIDGAEITDLRRYYSENQARNSVDIVTLDIDRTAGAQEFYIYHTLLKRQLKFFENGLHWMFYAGNQRVVRHDAIDGQLGLKYVGDDADCVYVGLVTGPFLDEHVGQERTNFTFSSDIQTEIHKAAISSAKNFLSDYIARIRAQQIETTSRVIRENPQFLPFRDALPTFVAENFSLNTQGEEDIFVELSRRKLRFKRRLDGQLRSLRESAENSVEQDVQQITQALNEEKKGSLAEYVVRRKAILDLLDSSLAYKVPERRLHYREEVIHELIVPLRTNSEDLDYTQHNLWILDDRLAFYTFFRSDKPLAAFVQGTESRKEPDLAVVFDHALAFQREGHDEPLVIIEFKRPGRDDYDGNSNPVTQVLEYVDLFRSGSGVIGKDGRLVKPINSATRFICYVVADFTSTLIKVVRASPANNPTADGRGYFGISTQHNATIEVMPYEKVLDDAKIRNEAFFRQLGLI